MNEQSTSDPQTGMDRFFGALRGMGIQRRTDDKWIAGVSSGLADRMGIDPVIVRAGFVLLALLGGVGITIYLVAWALIPNDRAEIMAQRALRDGDGGAIVLVVFAAMSLFGGTAFGGSWAGGHGWGFPWGVFLTGLLIWWLVKRSGNDTDADRRVRASQLGKPPAAGPSPTTTSTTVPQTQVLPQGQGFAQGPGFASGQGLPQSPAVPGTRVPPPQAQGWQERYADRRVVPKKPRRRSGGPLMALLALGLALATYGSLVWAGNVFSWTGDHRTIAIAGSLASIGLLSVVLGVAGWRAGFVTFLAVVLAVTAWTSAVVPAGIQVSGRVGDANWAPTSVSTSASEPTYHLGVGNGVLDLSGLTSQGLGATTRPVTIPASIGLGDLKVLVPPGLNVRVVGHVGLGAIVLPDDPDSNGQGGSDVSRSVVLGSGPTDIVVNAGVGIGQLTVVKE